MTLTPPAANNPMSSQEIVEFIIRLKLQEMKQGLTLTEQQLKEFDTKSRAHLKNAGDALEAYDKKGKALKDSMASTLSSIESSMRTFTATSVAGFTAITAAAGISAKAFGDFQAAANTLQAVSGASAKEMAMMEQKAMDLGAATKYSASQMLATQIELAKLGFTSKEVVDSIEGITLAAAASGTSLVNAGELIAGTVRGFGLAAKDATMVADVLAKASNATALGFDDLQLSMKYIAPVAAASNQKLTDMVAIMGYLSNNMIKGEQAGTSVRGMMAKLAAPSDEAARYMKAFNFSIEDANKKIKPLPQMMLELQDSLKGLSDKSRAKVLTELFGLEGLSAASALMKASKEELMGLVDELNRAGGTSKATGDIMNQGLNYQLEMLKSSAEGVAIAFGKELEPMLVDAIKVIKDLVEWFGQIPGPVKQTIVQVGLFGGALLAIGGTGGAALLFSAAIADATIKLGILEAGATAATSKVLALRSALLGVPGLVGLVVGGTAAWALNTAADQINHETSRRDDETAKVKERNDSQSRLNSFIRSGKNVEKATTAELQKALADIKELKTGLGDIVRAEKELADLKRQLPTQGGIGLTENDSSAEQNAQLATLKQKIAAKQQELELAKKSSSQAAAAAERYLEIEKKINAELGKRKTNGAAPGQPIDPAQEAKLQEQDREAKRKQLQQVDEYFKALSDKRRAAMDQIEKDHIKQQSQQEQGAVSGQKIAQIALQNVQEYSKRVNKSVAESSKLCYQEVYASLEKAGVAIGLYGRKAYQAIDGLKKSPHFKEVDWDRKSTLPAGAVVVWEKGNSPAGHISVADGQGNEISDFKGKQMTSHYGGGKAHVFIPKGQGAEEAAEIESIRKAQALLNQQIAEAIQYQSKYSKDSEAWKKAEAGIIALKQEASKLGIDLAKAEAKAVKEVREEQEKTWKQLSDSVESLQKSVKDRISDMKREAFQSGMSEFERMQDNFSREIEARKKEASDLEAITKSANMSALQKENILSRIKSLNQDIGELQLQQWEAEDRYLAKRSAKEMIDQYQQKLEFEEQSYKVLLDELELQKELMNEKEREFQFRKEAGGVSLEEETEFLIKQNAEKQKIAEDELALITQRAIDRGEEVEKSKEVLKAQHELNALRREGQKIVKDYFLTLADEAEAARAERVEMISATVQGLALISAEFGAIGQGISNMFKGMSSIIPLMDKAADSMNALTSQGASVGAEDVSNVAGLLTNLVGTFKSTVLGELTKQFTVNSEGFIAQMLQNELNLLQLDNQITASRIENKRRLGATTAELYEDEKALIESQAAAAAKAQELQIAQLKAKRSGAFGLFQTLEEQAAVTMAQQNIAKETLKINEDKHERLLELERRRLSEEEKLNKESQERRANIFTNFVEDSRARELEAAKAAGDVRKQYEIQREIDRAAAEKRFSGRKEGIDKAFNSGQMSEADYNFYNEKYLKYLNEDYANIDKALNKGTVQGDDPAKIEAENKARERRVELLKAEAAALAAKSTEDPFDDIQANYQQTLTDLAQAEIDAREKMTGDELDQALKNIAQKRINAEIDANKQIRDLQKRENDRYLNEYKDRLSQQKELIQQGVKIDSEQYESLIRLEEAKLKAIQGRIKAFQDQLEASKRQREQDKRPFNPNDAVQSSEFTSALAGVDWESAAYAGVDALSNTANRKTLGSVSKETQAKGLREQAELMRLQAENALKSERIGIQEYTAQIKQAQLLKAKSAELELQGESLTVRRRIELEGEWADAYAAYQDAARQAIDARYDIADQRIQQNMELEEQAATQAESNIDQYKAKISELEQAAAEKTALIDREIQRVNNSVLAQVGAWSNVASGIETARANLEKLQAQAAKMPGITTPLSGSGVNSGGTAPAVDRYIPTLSSKNDAQGFTVQGKNGWYRSEEDMRQAEGQGMSNGGFAPAGGQYAGDRYGPYYAQPKEAFVPFERWPEILNPVFRSGQMSAPQLTFSLGTGNTFFGIDDVHAAARQVGNELLNEYETRIRREAGPWG